MLKLYNTLGDCCFILFLFFFFIFAYIFVVYSFIIKLCDIYMSWRWKVDHFYYTYLKRLSVFLGQIILLFFFFVKKYDIHRCAKSWRHLMLRFFLLRMTTTNLKYYTKSFVVMEESYNCKNCNNFKLNFLVCIILLIAGVLYSICRKFNIKLLNVC